MAKKEEKQRKKRSECKKAIRLEKPYSSAPTLRGLEQKARKTAKWRYARAGGLQEKSSGVGEKKKLYRQL